MNDIRTFFAPISWREKDITYKESLNDSVEKSMDNSVEKSMDNSVEESMDNSVEESMDNSFKETQLNDQQQQVLDLVCQGKNVFITGSAGVGKSFLIKEICEILKNLKKGVQVLAPTGVAAINVSGVTLHSFIGWSPSTKTFEDILKKSRNLYKKWIGIDVVIIDEVSMINETILNLFEQVCRYFARNPNKIFGGIQVIFVGDLLQLPPIEGHPYIFDLDIWKKLDIQICYLTKIIRQTDSFFSAALNDIRLGNYSNNVKKMISRGKRNIQDPEKEYVYLYATNKKKDIANQHHLDSLESEAVIYMASDTGSSQHFRDTLIMDKVVLKVGCRVMLIKNRTDDGLCNGSVGLVVNFENGFPVVQFNNISLLITREKWEVTALVNKKNVVIATRTQIPLVVAYALTIHKTQSLTLDNVILDCSGIFTYGQLYVALSRVKTLQGLIIKNFHPNHIKVDEKVVEFYKNIIS